MNPFSHLGCTTRTFNPWLFPFFHMFPLTVSYVLFPIQVMATFIFLIISIGRLIAQLPKEIITRHLSTIHRFKCGRLELISIRLNLQTHFNQTRPDLCSHVGITCFGQAVSTAPCVFQPGVSARWQSSD